MMPFNFKPLTPPGDKPIASQSERQTSLADKVANFQFTPPTPAADAADATKIPNTEPSNPLEIAAMQLPTDDYTWDGQPIANEDDALVAMRSNLELLQQAFGSDGVDMALYRCLNFLDQHAFLKDILQPEDVQLMMRGLSMSAAEVVETKTSNRKKRTKRAESEASMAADLGDIDLGI